MPESSDSNNELGLPAQQNVLRFLESLVTAVSASKELLSDIPQERAREIVRMAELKAGAGKEVWRK